MNLLVTGASGFIGSAVLRNHFQISAGGVRGATRQHVAGMPEGTEQVIVGDLDANTDWTVALRGIDVLVHTAARVHVMRDISGDPLAEFFRVNVAGTLNLGRQAAQAGVRRFVFISSIKVNGGQTFPGRPYRADDDPAPVDPYGVSKYEAEKQLHRLASETGMDVVIVRPVLVYGPGVKGNFLELMRWLKKGIPLPLGAVHNRRSLVALDNLIDLIETCVRHPNAANQTFLVSDGEDLSTTELISRTAEALGTRARLVAVPTALLRKAAQLSGKSNVGQRLLESLQVDITKASQLLGWAPRVPVSEALKRVAEHFLHSDPG